MLQDRRPQVRALDALLADVRAGRSRALVVRGEPGIGKTALLSYAADTAPQFQVAHAEGVESEMELPFSALHQLCGRMLHRLDRLPPPQRDALSVALGLRSGSAPDRFLVNLAVLGLLSDVAAEQPLLCLIDDAQWLDQTSAQALAFVARRLDAESVAMIFGTRDPAGGDLTGFPELTVGGLSDADARVLLAAVIPGRLDERVRDRIIAESGGNALALLELPHGVSVAELAGGFGVAGPLALAGRIEQSFLRRIARLPEVTQRLLLVAAAEPVGDPALLWQAAARLGVGADAAAAAEADGLLTVGARVIFRHPLVRSAVYQTAPVSDRRIAHRALAEATDPGTDPDRRAWHRAQSVTAPDEEIAAELERSAGRAQARGGLAAAAAFLARAAELTPEPARRAQRALAAAQATHRAGTPDPALGLLSIADLGPLDALRRAQVELLRAQIAFTLSRGSDAPPLLLKAAKLLEPLDVGLARGTYLQALWAARFVGRGGAGLLEAAEAALAALPAPQPPRALDLLLDGLAVLLTQGYRAGIPNLKLALSAFRGESISREDELRWLQFACYTAVDVWDDEAWEALSIRHVQLARDAGALSELPMALAARIAVHLNAGELAAAASLVEELQTVTEITGSQIAPFGALGLAAWQGRDAQAAELFEASVKEVLRGGRGVGLTAIAWARAQLYNSLGRYEEALAAAEQASEHPQDLLANWGQVELIEAAARSGRLARAADALRRLSESTRASDTDWALGIEARSQALLSDGDVAERLYREAIDRLGRTRVRGALARAHLLYGEWLRRQNRRIDAREQLRTAHQLFTSMPAEGFAERAARELRATGERVRARTTDPPDQLTGRETQIARLAGDGLSNQEIATQLFMSPRTVEYHLHKVFNKLAISSRKPTPRRHGQPQKPRAATNHIAQFPGRLPCRAAAASNYYPQRGGLPARQPPATAHRVARRASPRHPHFLQCKPQGSYCVVQPRLHRSFSNLEIVGDLRRRPPQVVRAPNYRAVLEGQLCQRVPDQQPVQRGIHLVGAGTLGRTSAVRRAHLAAEP
jgi:DNA-binding CsgD family transcriptional regulator